MTKSQNPPTTNKRANHLPAQTITPQTEAGSEDEPPTVTELYTVLGSEYRVLPYDADAVAKAVLDAVIQDFDSVVTAADVQDIADIAEEHADVVFPDLVVTRAEIALQDEYNDTVVKTALHLMSAHGKSIQDENCPVSASVTVEQDVAQPEETRAFIMVRTLGKRTQRAIAHLAGTSKQLFTRSTSRTKSLFAWNRQ